ncbi:hypothetical protein BC941DRAFT_196202 [Chlamydoabsidia padenii]|nr:hypothetical protein BC941DRAFT_196202 [Chlamydoabsidia padenii]
MMDQSTQCLTPRSSRRRRLIQKKNNFDPETESLYHDETRLISPTRNQSTPVTVGTPSKLQQARTPQHDNDMVALTSSSIFSSSLSLNERLNKVIKQDTKTISSPLDLSTYQLVPSQMEAAVSAVEPIFSRHDFFQDPPQEATDISPSPTCSIVSDATSISDHVNMALLSWPSSPDLSQQHQSALSFGRVGMSSSSISSPPAPSPTLIVHRITKRLGPVKVTLPRRWAVKPSRTKPKSVWILA